MCRRQPIGRGRLIRPGGARTPAALLTAILLCLLVLGASVQEGCTDMMADSPVTFPEQGALPSKYPPDLRPEQRLTSEEGYHLFTTPQRSLEQIAAIQAEMPQGRFTPPAGDWSHLERTRKILTEGGDLCILALGDSIVNDTMRSGWVAKLSEAYPKANIRAWVYVRSRGACRHYKEENRVARYVVPRKPDLVFVGGISQGGEIENIRTVIHQLRAALPEVEILLATGTFGAEADPRRPEELAKAGYSGAGDYGLKLKELARQEQSAYLDMTAPWAEYIRSTGLHPHLLYRDRVHANEYGEQILSKILMSFFTFSDEQH